jgi:hypothetical protein
VDRIIPVCVLEQSDVLQDVVFRKPANILQERQKQLYVL